MTTMRALLLLVALCASVVSSSTDTVSKEDRVRGIFFGALVADSLSLGSHYEYDAVKIKQAYQGEIDKFMAPGEQMGGETHGIGWGSQNYHKGTVAGDQTDYGEYNVLILEHLARITPGDFTVGSLLPEWKHRLMGGEWKQWVCTQTKHVFMQLGRGTPESQLGGNSNAMALRYAPVFAYTNDEADVVEYARYTMFTHREQTALLGNEFFARVTYRILHKNMTPRQAIDAVAAKMKNPFISEKVQQAIDKVEEAIDSEKDLSKEEFVDDLALTSMARLWDVGKSEPIKVGKASPTEGTLPGSIYFILKYQDDMIGAFKANAMVGGDNASRSIAIGMVLGAYHGVGAIDQKWRDGLNHWKYCEEMLEQLPLLEGSSTTPSSGEL
jgi:ADP-ribosylglycohydrolase